MPSNKKQKMTKVEKMRRKIKSHSINTRNVSITNSWARSEQVSKSCGRMSYNNEFETVIKFK